MPKRKLTVTYASCTLLVNYDTTCPLCRGAVKANQTHTCERPATPAKVGQMLAETLK